MARCASRHSRGRRCCCRQEVWLRRGKHPARYSSRSVERCYIVADLHAMQCPTADRTHRGLKRSTPMPRAASQGTKRHPRVRFFTLLQVSTNERVPLRPRRKRLICPFRYHCSVTLLSHPTTTYNVSAVSCQNESTRNSLFCFRRRSDDDDDDVRASGFRVPLNQTQRQEARRGRRRRRHGRRLRARRNEDEESRLSSDIATRLRCCS